MFILLISFHLQFVFSIADTTCSAGTGWYVNSGCLSGYYCHRIITNKTCPSGYLYDERSYGSCRLASQVVCKPSVGTCSNANPVFYAQPGCKAGYSCFQSIASVNCTNGFLFDPVEKYCRAANQVQCSSSAAPFKMQCYSYNVLTKTETVLN